MALGAKMPLWGDRGEPLWEERALPVQTYIRSMDKDFVAATIQAIGRCATNIGKVRDTCLNGLVQLLSNRDGEHTWWG